ncbi:MAG: deoxyribonuclease, partial [Myxococcota bacterium]
IGAGETVVVASLFAGYVEQYGEEPDFAFRETTDASKLMVDPGAAIGRTLVGSNTQLSNDGEGLALFFWDGQSDLVTDIDLVSAGLNPAFYNRLADKTGASVDGPDADTATSTYADDAYSFNEVTGDAGNGTSHKRIFLDTEDFEVHDGVGNGLSGDDETSEQFGDTWDLPSYTAPTPGTIDF